MDRQGYLYAINKMSCTLQPPTTRVLLQQLIEVTFVLRKTPFPGPSVQNITDEFRVLYPSSTSTDDEILAQLRYGAKRGVFTLCEFPSYSQIYYYAFNRNMIIQNVKNREFSLPILYDNVGSGSSYPTRMFPIGGAQTQGGGFAQPNDKVCSLMEPI